MTTQAVALTVNGPGNQGGRKYANSGAITDGQWTSITTVNGTAQLGFAQKGRTINNVTLNYAAGGAAFAIKNRVTQTLDRVGFGSLSAATGVKGYSIDPIMVVQDHVLQVYPLAAGTTYLAWVKMHNRPAELFSGTIANGAEGELTTVTDSSGIGSFADQSIEWIKVQGSDGKIVQYVSIYDANGGELFNQLAGEREVLGGAMGGTENACISNLNIPIMRGMALKLTVQA